ncbi:MAG: hypothetical protein NZM12_07850, partial [Steroidobacteraceae bacterium]|nr:hypothetical protein [Steroidobacteraceae bacterium]MDW8258352.1 hypothetical protein [Gammaproteobacteria bacterium]
LTAAELRRARFNPDTVMLDGDDVRVIGSGWIEPYEFAYIGNGGHLHLFAKALHVDWTDWRWRLAPERFRGALYCHLAAPEYIRALMLGEMTAPQRQR